MKTERLTFPGGQGHELAAYLNTPENGEPAAYALFAHCFTCTKNLKAARNIGLALADEGIAAFRFDFTGLGESEGDFADTNFSSNVEDLIRAADFMRERYAAPAILIGHSLGGAAVLQAAHAIPECKAVATIAAPANPAHVSNLFADKREDIETRGEARVNLAGRSFTIKKQFLDDLESGPMNRSIDELDRALIVFHSPFDGVVGVDNAAEIFKRAKHPKSFVSLHRADHLLSRESDSRYVGRLIACWSRMYL